MKIIFKNALTTCLVIVLSATASLTSADTKPKLSVQLWSVKDALTDDFKGTISALAKMGFEGVELAGNFGEFNDDPKGESLSDKNIDETLEFYSLAGVPMLLIPYDARAGKAESIEQTIADLNRLTHKVEAAGIRFGYHNHDFEFGDYKQATYWDAIATSTSESFVMQLDVGWVHFMGKDPVEYVRKYPNRTLSTHYKATLRPNVKDKLPIIGKDSIDWVKLLAANIEVGGTQWIVLEQEEYPDGLSPLEAVKLSKQGLDKYLSN